MTVSAIITTFNRATIVPDAIRSVFSQTIPVDELIVVDDGSTDDTKGVVTSMIPEAPINLRYIKKLNGGMAAALNRGMEEALFDYVAFLDDDDLWHPDHIEKSLGFLTRNPYMGAVMALRDEGNVVQTPPEKLLAPYERHPTEKNLLIHRARPFAQSFFTAALGTSVIRKDLAVATGFDAEVGARLDIFFFWMLSEKTDIGLHLESHGIARQFRISYLSTDKDAPPELKDAVVLRRSTDGIKMLKKVMNGRHACDSEGMTQIHEKLRRQMIWHIHLLRKAGKFREAFGQIVRCFPYGGYASITKELLLCLLRYR